MFPEWWYGIFWDAKFKDKAYVSDGLQYLAPQHSSLAVWILGCVTALILILLLLPTPVFALLDRFSRAFVAACLAILVVHAVIVYRHRVEYERWVHINDTLSMVGTDALNRFKQLTQRPDIEAPIYFHYLNGQRINALFNQLQPAMEETSREVRTGANLEGGAEVAGAVGKLSVQGKKSEETQSKYDKASSTPERECFEVMKYARKTWPNNYYSDAFDWYMIQELRPVVQQLEAVQSDGEPSLPRPASRDWKEVTRHTEEQLTRMETELSVVRGLIFVEGDFDRSADSGSVVLLHNFADGEYRDMKRRKVFFKVSLARNDAQALPAGKKLHLRVFGDVMKPLDKEGFIDVAPVAIF